MKGTMWGYSLITIALVTLGAARAAAGDGQIGDNGGDVVSCRSVGQQGSVEMLDLFEARTLYSLELIDYAALPYTDIVESALERLATRDPSRASFLRQYWTMLAQHIVFLKDIHLQDVPDSNHIIYPRGCSLLQIAVQKAPILANDPRLLIDKNLWEQLDEAGKAALMLHEIIYAAELERPRKLAFNANLSDRAPWVRRFVGFLMSKNFALLSDTDYHLLIASYVREMRGSADVMVCTGSAKRTVSTFARYEAATWRGLKPAVEINATTWQSALKAMLTPLAALDTDRAFDYENASLEFLGKSRFLTGIALVDVEDDSYLGLPINCTTEQLVLQRPFSDFQGVSYIVNSDLFAELSPAEQAEVILHEIAYREIFSAGGDDVVASPRTRYLTTQISFGFFSNMASSTYQLILEQVGLTGKTNVNGMRVFIGSDQRDQYGRLTAVNLASPWMAEVQPEKVVRLGCQFERPDANLNRVTFSGTGLVTMACLADGANLVNVDGAEQRFEAFDLVSFDHEQRATWVPRCSARHQSTTAAELCGSK